MATKESQSVNVSQNLKKIRQNTSLFYFISFLWIPIGEVTTLWEVGEGQQSPAPGNNYAFTLKYTANLSSAEFWTLPAFSVTLWTFSSVTWLCCFLLIVTMLCFLFITTRSVAFCCSVLLGWPVCCWVLPFLSQLLFLWCYCASLSFQSGKGQLLGLTHWILSV